MSAQKAFGLGAELMDAYEAIVSMMESGIADPRFDELAPGPSSTRGIEKFARTICEYDLRADLGITYALAAVATCVAGQGGFVLRCPLSGGGFLEVPLVNHTMGVAPSGWRKSSALRAVQKPLDEALDMGERQRREILAGLLSSAKAEVRDSLPVDQVLDDKQFTEVFGKGLCSFTIIGDPTVETLRNMAVNNGGSVAVMAAEADVFRNVTQYSQPGSSASLTLFLDLWDQARISSGRVGAGMMVMDEAVLNMAVLFQTDVFAEVTGGTNGADSFMARGIFGRCWVVETTLTGGWEDIAALYPDDATHESTTPDQISRLVLVTQAYTRNLQDLVTMSNDYRMNKALNHAWKAAATKLSDELQVPEIAAQERKELTLSRTGLTAYNQVQRLYMALEKALEAMDEDSQMMWGPLASRFVQHVMREAMIITLSSGSEEVTGETIMDAATRIIPWRWALTVNALAKRTRDRAEDIVEQSAKDNRNGDDVTIQGRIVKMMSRMTSENPELRARGWTKRDIGRRVTSALPRPQRKGGVGKEISKVLLEMSEDTKTTGISRVDGGTNPVNGLPIERFSIADWALIYG